MNGIKFPFCSKKKEKIMNVYEYIAANNPREANYMLSGYGYKNFHGNYSGDGHGGSSGKGSPQKRFRGIGEGGGFSSGRGYEGFTGWGQGSDIKQ